MNIVFKNRKIEKQFCYQYRKSWKYPQQVQLKLKMTEDYIRSASSLLDIANYTPFHFHQLKGDRKGEWSIYLGNTGYRVVLVPCDDNEKKILEGDIMSKCKSIKVVQIMEVSNHYE